MASDIGEINSRLTMTLLMEIVDCARRGRSVNQFGIKDTTLADLTTMSVSEMHIMAGTSLVDFKINERALNLVVQRLLASRNRNNLIDDVMLKGASRAMMSHYAKMTSKDFHRRRSHLGIENQRNRPSSLSANEYDALAIAHSKHGQLSQIKESSDHLKTLLFLANKTSIDINRIYTYYYLENECLFISDSGEAI